MPPKKAQPLNGVKGKKFLLSVKLDEADRDAVSSSIVNAGGKVVKTNRGVVDVIVLEDKNDDQKAIVPSALAVTSEWVEAELEGKSTAAFVVFDPSAAAVTAAAAAPAGKGGRGRKAVVPAKVESESDEEEENVVEGKKFFLSPDLDDADFERAEEIIDEMGGKIAKTTRGAVDFVVVVDEHDVNATKVSKATPISLAWLTAAKGGKSVSEHVITPAAAPAPATKRAARTQKTSVADSDNDDGDGDDDDDAKKKPAAKAAPVSKKVVPAAVPVPVTPTAAAAATTTVDTKKDDDNKKVQLGAVDIGTKSHANKGIIPTDQYVPNSHQWQVITEGTGDNFFCYDFMMNQTNIGQNNNKFYLVQVLKNLTNPNQFAAFFRWGRVDEPGANQFHTCGSRQAAISMADKKVKDKSTHNIATIIANRNVPTKPGKYTYLQRVADLVEDDDDDDDDENGGATAGPKAKSKLHPRLIALMEMISDVDMINRSLVDFGFDAKKSPLGKLSKDVLLRGLEVLKELEDEVTGKKSGHVINELSSKFYTLIPHSFGRSVPPPIRTEAEIKNKTALVESLLDIEASKNTLFLKPKSEEEMNIIDQKYKALNCELKYVDPKSQMYQLIQNYAKQTTGSTHSWAKGVTISDIFEVHREDEVARQNAYKAKHPHHSWNKQLLWHGSRVQNFTGILSTGLRMPKQLVNVPICGAMFDQGSYSADSFSKSYNYCTTNQNKEGCILLLEVMLGGVEPMYNACYTASQHMRKENNAILGLGRERPVEDGCQFIRWNTTTGEHEIISREELDKMKHYYHHQTTSEKDVGKQIHPHSLYTAHKDHAADIVKVPMGLLSAANDKYQCLQYNEYIVFNVEQIRIKYICRFQQPANTGRWW